MGLKVFTPPKIKSTDELELMMDLISVHLCVLRINGLVDATIHDRAKVLLAFYIMYGITPETRESALSLLGIKLNIFHSYNHQLRKAGLIDKGKYNEKVNTLSDLIKPLETCYSRYKENGNIMYLVELGLDGDSV